MVYMRSSDVGLSAWEDEIGRTKLTSTHLPSAPLAPSQVAQPADTRLAPYIPSTAVVAAPDHMPLQTLG